MSVAITILALVASIFALGRALHDHYAMKQHVREFRCKLDQAEQLLKMRANLANEVAHEIKNPLTAVLCSVEALDLLIGEKIDEDHRKTLHYTKEYGNILLRLVTDFLDLSRAEVGELSCKPEPIEVKSSIESIAGLLQTQAIEKKISISLESDRTDLHAFIDPGHFKQIIFNLLYNAIKYTPAGGLIHIGVEADSFNGMVNIEVSDTGEGIVADRISSVFDLYTRYDDSDRHDQKLEIGTGLGLALVKSLVEMAGGSVNVNSVSGEGSTFDLSIPLYDRNHDTNCDPYDLITQPLLGLKFLIVDEDLGSRESVASLIMAWGGMVDLVEFATETVEALGSADYDAVMIDDSVKSVDSFELAKTIKGRKAKDAPAVIIAGRQSDAEKRAREVGADGYVEKPFNGNCLLESLIDTQGRH